MIITRITMIDKRITIYIIISIDLITEMVDYHSRSICRLHLVDQHQALFVSTSHRSKALFFLHHANYITVIITTVTMIDKRITIYIITGIDLITEMVDYHSRSICRLHLVDQHQALFVSTSHRSKALFFYIMLTISQ